MVSATPDKKKRRLGGLFGGGSKKAGDAQPSNTRPSFVPKTADSGYGGSINGAHTSSSKNPDIVPVENTGQVEGVSVDRNLAVNQTTGEVLDDDTGEVVTTVTTTTTTTTTTVKRARSPRPNSLEQSSASNSPSASFHTARPHDSEHQQSLHVPGGGSQRINATHSTPQTPGVSDDNDPPVSVPTSTTRPNFSRPVSRTGTQASKAETQGSQKSKAGREHPKAPRGPFSNIRATAIGLRSAVESIRDTVETVGGAIEGEIDSYQKRQREYNAAADLKNQARPPSTSSSYFPTTSSTYFPGMSSDYSEPVEMPSERDPVEAHDQQKPVELSAVKSRSNTPKTKTPERERKSPVQRASAASPHAPPDPMYHPNLPKASDSRSQVPPSFSPESNGQVGEAKGGKPFGKLLKRKSEVDV